MRPHRDVGQAELRLDHLALLGHAQPAVDRTRRLRPDREVGRAAAAADAAAAAVEQRQLDAVPRARGDDLFLRAVELPRRGEPAGVLRRVGVADHHLLVARDARAIPRQREQRVEHRAGALQIGGGLEQRHHALRMRGCRPASAAARRRARRTARLAIVMT